MNNSIFQKIYAQSENISDENIKNALQDGLVHLKKQKLNILFVGATGVGKSSTINAIFDTEKAKVGNGVYPETSTLHKYDLNNLVLWDSPGFGDDVNKDKMYAMQLYDVLRKKDEHGNALIDGVVVLLDASQRDMNTAYEVINNVILPALNNDSKHLVIALNQCDMALKGKHWDDVTKQPDSKLIERLDEKAISIRDRIKDSTHISVDLPIYYSALHKYNISKFLIHLITSLPATKRYIVADSLNTMPTIWESNDDLKNYNKEIQVEIKNSMQKALENSLLGAKIGAEIGKIIPVVGPVIGASVGAVLGFLGSFFD